MEFLLELDLLTLRNALWAGYLLTLVLPVAAVYIFHNSGGVAFNKRDAAFLEHQRKLAINVSGETYHFGVKRFYTYICRKEAPDDSEGPSNLQIVTTVSNNLRRNFIEKQIFITFTYCITRRINRMSSVGRE